MEGEQSQSNNKKETFLSGQELKELDDLIKREDSEPSEEQRELQRRLDMYGTEFAPKISSEEEREAA